MVLINAQKIHIRDKISNKVPYVSSSKCSYLVESIYASFLKFSSNKRIFDWGAMIMDADWC